LFLFNHHNTLHVNSRDEFSIKYKTLKVFLMRTTFMGQKEEVFKRKKYYLEARSGDCCLISVEPTRMFFPYFFSIITGDLPFLCCLFDGHIKMFAWMKEAELHYVTIAIRFMFYNYTYNMLLVALWGAGRSDLSSKAKNYYAIWFMFCNYTYNMLAQIYHLKQRITERLREMGRSFLHKLVHWRIDLSAFSNAFVVFFADCLHRYGNVFYGHENQMNQWIVAFGNLSMADAFLGSAVEHFIMETTMHPN
ncbi:hypothetical protein ACJX0J_024481, partial [Zea mays]